MVRFLLVIAACAACGDDAPPTTPDPDAPPTGDPPVFALAMRDQIERMEASTLASEDLVTGYRARIARLDEPETGIHSILALDPAAATTATTVDGARGSGKLLQGAVILLKDNIDTAGLATTAGSLALAGNVPAQDAFVTAKLRAANGVVIGKANLSEWANFRGYASTSGWSSVGGQTRHAHLAGFNPCGSSSGSAAAVAAGLVSASLGTETNGSISCPAAINGIVGFKPTVGLVSRTGVIPIASSQDTVGPMTRTVGDAARLMRVIAGPDAADPATSAIPAAFDYDFEAPLATASLAGKRIGVLRPAGFVAGVFAVFDAEIAKLTAAGATVVNVSVAGYDGNDELLVLLTEFKFELNAYLASHARSGQPASLAELIQYNTDHAAEVMPYFGQQLFTQAQATTGIEGQAYLDARARAKAAAGANGLLAALDGLNLDVIIAPTNGAAWTTNYQTGDQFTGGSGHFAAVAGYPHLTVPMGFMNQFAIGLSFFGRPFEDAKVLAIGYAYEQLRGSSRTLTRVEDHAPAIVQPARAGM